MTQFVREYRIAKTQHYMDDTGLLAVRLAIVPSQAIEAHDYRSVDLEFLGDDANTVFRHRVGDSIELGDYEVVMHCVGSRALLMEWGILPYANKGENDPFSGSA